MELLECPLCLFLMCEPVTVPCGHSFCRRCVKDFLPSKCPQCKERLKPREVRDMRNNVLLISVAEKCWPEESKMKCHIQEKLKASLFMEALRITNEGIDSVPGDLSLKFYRAEANLGLMHLHDALTDLDYLCCLRPNWTEILEAEGVAVPEEVPGMLQVVSEYLKEPFPITSLSSSQGPAYHDALSHPQGADGEGKARREPLQVNQDTECCLSLCQAVSFLPAAEEDEELMMRKEFVQFRAERSLNREKTLSILSVSDFECPLCIRLFFEPVTTPCGHTFCKNCLERSLDHNLRCPLCKQALQEYFKNRKFNVTVLLQGIMTRLFPSQLEEREQIHNAEMAELSNLTKDIPIFVCTVAYPGVPCPLHIFEPRYRLMMRRCMETGTKKFGMCSYEHGKGFADYGCILEINTLELLPDGRSHVDTVGGSRFRVLKRGQRDGYHTADIELLEDQRVDGTDLEMLEHLHDSVYQQAQDWYQRLGSRLREQINRQYGVMPEKEEDIQASINGPIWCWWLLSVLQLDPAYQTTVLSLNSLKDRLGHLRLVLEYFSQS
uniref:LON peptidase N-terminal domain and ring finger 1 n=1 Tax=Neogobius melanostomus TaxID=47308 RepID=A0A8C6TIQ2_9GOBI